MGIIHLLRLLITTLLLSLLVAAPLAQAQSAPSDGKRAEQGFISQARAGKIASNKFGGKVIDVRTLKSKAGTIHRVRLLQSSGRVITVHVDASSGRIL